MITVVLHHFHSRLKFFVSLEELKEWDEKMLKVAKKYLKIFHKLKF
jgi:hypothetical protein